MMKLLHFYAEDWVPCEQQRSVLELLENEYDIEIKHVPVESHRADKFDIEKLPSMVLVENGSVQERIERFAPLRRLRNIIDSHM